MLFREGDMGDSMFVILAGSVNVLKRSKISVDSDEMRDQVVASLRDGAIFGDYALLGGD